MQGILSKEYDNHWRWLFPATCETCKADMLVPKHVQKRFCSKKCQGLNTRNRSPIDCAQCKVSFERSPSKLLNSKSGLQFCSRICKEKAQCLEGMQEIHPPHYNTGLGLARYRTLALRTYGKECNSCGYDKFVKMLDVHHIDGDRSNGAVDNLVVLCLWSHGFATRKTKPHRWNGKLTSTISPKDN